MTAGILTDDQMNEMYDRAIRFAREECHEGACPIESELISCVQQSVKEASTGTTILTYVPVLAMRRVRECIKAGSCGADATGATA